MALVRIRRLILIATVGSMFVMVFGVWIGRISLGICHEGISHIDSLLAATMEVTAGVGAVGLAVVFLTAQLSAGRPRPSVLAELYSSPDGYILAVVLVGTIVFGYISLLLVPSTVPRVLERFVDTTVVLAITTVIMVGPTFMAQLENLHPIVLASKLSSRLRADEIVGYGLTEVEIIGFKKVQYRIVSAGIRPLGIDPFRPLHEVFMEAVVARDRVLFGKLYRYLLGVIARTHGSSWEPQRLMISPRAPGPLCRFGRRRYTDVVRIHVTLAVMHYSLKRARNMLREWDMRDIGRHGIITGISDLIISLSFYKEYSLSIRICIYCILHISKVYAGVAAFGRLEPLEVLAVASSILGRRGFWAEAILSAELLGWVAVHTDEVTMERVPSIGRLDPVLQIVFEKSKTRARRDIEWLPGKEEEDPWRKWPR